MVPHPLPIIFATVKIDKARGRSFLLNQFEQKGRIVFPIKQDPIPNKNWPIIANQNSFPINSFNIHPI